MAFYRQTQTLAQHWLNQGLTSEMSALYLTNDDVFTPRGFDKQITLQQGV